MSTLKVAAINNPSAGSGGLAISAAGNVTGAGLDLIVTESFSAVASISLDNVFTGDYDNYRVLVNVTSASATTASKMRLRSGGADSTATAYNFQYAQFSAATPAYNRVTESSWDVTNLQTTNGMKAQIELLAPAEAISTGLTIFGTKPEDGIFLRGGIYTATTVFDGFTLYPASGTISGTVSVYGYKS